MLASYEIVCAYCGSAASLTQPGRFCNRQHRAYFHRDELRAQRRRLAAQAETAAVSGDVEQLERVAREAASLLLR
jgi:hypothetical protein